MSDILKIGQLELKSRLIVGSGKYPDFKTTRALSRCYRDAAATEVLVK